MLQKQGGRSVGMNACRAPHAASTCGKRVNPRLEAEATLPSSLLPGAA